MMPSFFRSEPAESLDVNPFAVRVHVVGQGITDFGFASKAEAETFAHKNWNPSICTPGVHEWAEVIEKRFTLDGEPLDLADFVAVNADDDQIEIDAIAALKVGESITYGGGAFATFVLTRIA